MAHLATQSNNNNDDNNNNSSPTAVSTVAHDDDDDDEKDDDFRSARSSTEPKRLDGQSICSSVSNDESPSDHIVVVEAVVEASPPL